MRFDGTRRAGRRLGLTPLIDVVFLLLIFFMLASAPDRTGRLPLELASTRVASREDTATALRIELAADGTLRLAGRRVTRAALAQGLREALAAHPTRPVLIVPAPDATLQQMVWLVESVEASGGRDVAFARSEDAG